MAKLPACACLCLCLTLAAGPASGQPPFLTGAALDGYPLTVRAIRAAEASLGFPVSLAVFFLQWPADPAGGEFPRSSLEAAEEAGAAACVTWEPMYVDAAGEHAIPAADILSGAWDGYLTRFARGAAAWGRPFLLRFGHEMNLSRYHWGTDAASYGPKSPELYKAMFRRVHDIFRREGAGDVLFVFCPNAESVPSASMTPPAAWNTASAYYPGNDRVDVLGMDGYNWGTTRTRAAHGWDSSFLSFERIFGSLFRELTALAPGKPVVVFETASAAQGGDKARWVREAADTARAWKLAGLAWFEAAKEVDWRLASGAGPDPGLPLRRLASPAPAWFARLRP